MTDEKKPYEPHSTRRDGLPNFDADFSPEHPQNQAAAKARRLRYDAAKEMYVDADGALILDKFGQPL
jgi:hypothetical protein